MIPSPANQVGQQVAAGDSSLCSSDPKLLVLQAASEQAGCPMSRQKFRADPCETTGAILLAECGPTAAVREHQTSQMTSNVLPQAFRHICLCRP